MNAYRAALMLALANSASAQPLTVTAWTVAGGGGTSSSVRFTLAGTIAQPDADPLHPATSASARYALTGGFWMPLASASVFGNGFEDPP